MKKEKQTGKSENTVFVSTFTDGILDPEKQMLGPVGDGGTIIANTAPGCWGPMITPSLKGGHEVTQPVAVENAEPGDAVAIRIRDITVTSIATASGYDEMIDGYFLGDPYVAAKCPNCDKIYPETRIEGTGPEAIRCATCGQPVTPFRFLHGYTVVFDKAGQVGVTVDKSIADRLAEDPKFYSACPENSQQASVLVYTPVDLVGVVARMRPFLGQLGSTPAVRLPDSHNAGDFGMMVIWTSTLSDQVPFCWFRSKFLVQVFIWVTCTLCREMVRLLDTLWMCQEQLLFRLKWSKDAGLMDLCCSL
jgi:formamidase